MMIQDKRIRSYLSPLRIVWSNGNIRNAESLLSPGSGQATIWSSPGTFLPPGASILLDYGKELHGGIQLISGRSATEFVDECILHLRVRFGESVSEAMGEPDNQHAVHDSVISVPPMGSVEFGSTGFRFVRIDNVEKEKTLEIRELRAVFLRHDLEYKGSFESDDPLLNRIWHTGAYTVHLCMQDYLWDGIKRDRLVWMGDMHPELMVAATVFGKTEIVERSLDLVRNETVLPRFMNGMSSYSLCWIIAHDAWFRFFGDIGYLKQQHSYLKGLLENLLKLLNDEGAENIDAKGSIIDWAYFGETNELRGGFQALLCMALESASRIFTALEDANSFRACRKGVELIRKSRICSSKAKSVNALQVLAGIKDSYSVNTENLSVRPLERLSTFPGYYILNARAAAGDYQASLELIRKYWGGMLELGATSFWEHFDISWLENAGRIDELAVPGRTDVHKSYGTGCFKGLRNSFCHGWAAGPTAWLSEHILGVNFLASDKIVLSPHLSGLKTLCGTVPTALGMLKIECLERKDGKIFIHYEAPEKLKLSIPEHFMTSLKESL